jgi:hypothetical protein
MFQGVLKSLMQRKQSAGKIAGFVHAEKPRSTAISCRSRAPRRTLRLQIRAETAFRIFSLRLDWLFHINLELAEYAFNSLIQSQMSLGL